MLFKYEGVDVKADSIPVLYVPGHRGAYSQSRSLAFHNNGTFQYFALQFHDNNAALHGSVIVKQAILVNEALREIHRLYTVDRAKKGKGKGKGKGKKQKQPKAAPKLKVAVVGHSLGGLVARVAVLLQNHPRCLVNNLIMLSTPNRAPSYPLDASLETITQATNAAWRFSYYNSSAHCASQAQATFTDIYGQPVPQRPVGGDDGHNDDDGGLMSIRKDSDGGAATGEPRLGANFQCPRCVPRMRLLSITGGSLDDMVAPHLTHLNHIDPVSNQFRVKRKLEELAADEQAREQDAGAGGGTIGDRRLTCMPGEEGADLCWENLGNIDSEFGGGSSGSSGSVWTRTRRLRLLRTSHPLSTTLS